MGIIGTLIVIVLFFAALKAIADTEKGGFIIIIMPLILIVINFTIGWENYWSDVPFPNPIDLNTEGTFCVQLLFYKYVSIKTQRFF